MCVHKLNNLSYCNNREIAVMHRESMTNVARPFGSNL